MRPIPFYSKGQKKKKMCDPESQPIMITGENRPRSTRREAGLAGSGYRKVAAGADHAASLCFRARRGEGSETLVRPNQISGAHDGHISQRFRVIFLCGRAMPRSMLPAQDPAPAEETFPVPNPILKKVAELRVVIKRGRGGAREEPAAHPYPRMIHPPPHAVEVVVVASGLWASGQRAVTQRSQACEAK